jgi:transcriptional regulator
MYTPRAFAGTDLAALDQLFARDPFVTLLTPGADGGWPPLASHLPVLYRRDGEAVTLEGHWARPNPQAATAADGGDALVIVHGPHAYISAGWYPDKDAAARVPTWNYAVAHLHGRLQSFDDADALGALVSRLSATFEAGVGSDWRFEPERPEHARQLRGIVGFRLEVQRIELKLKLSQNHPAPNIDAASAALLAQPSTVAHDTSAWMRQWRPTRAPTQD